MLSVKDISPEQKLTIAGSGVAGLVISLIISQGSSSIKDLNTRLLVGGMIGLAAGYLVVKTADNNKKK